MGFVQNMEIGEHERRIYFDGVVLEKKVRIVGRETTSKTYII